MLIVRKVSVRNLEEFESLTSRLVSEVIAMQMDAMYADLTNSSKGIVT